jgi:hypothetical protein
MLARGRLYWTKLSLLFERSCYSRGGNLMEPPMSSHGGLEHAAPVWMRFRLATELDDEPLHSLGLSYGEPSHHEFLPPTDFQSRR